MTRKLAKMGKRKTDIHAEAQEILASSISRHLSKDWIHGCLLDLYEEGVTDEDVRGHIPMTSRAYSATNREILKSHSDEMTAKMTAVLEDARDAGLLSPIPHGADRGIGTAVIWNNFLSGDAMEPHQTLWLFDAPLPRLIGRSLWTGGYEALLEMRKARGMEPHAGYRPDEKVGPRADMPIGKADLEAIAAAAAAEAVKAVRDPSPMATIGMDRITCPKTDTFLSWKENTYLEPVMGIQSFPEGKPSQFEEIGAFEKPAPLRHVEITVPSGTLLMADWFRIPGFNEGVAERDLEGPSINSELGIDERTQDHYERLGLMRIHTTNCMPKILRDGDAFRIGYFDEDDDALWEEDSENPGMDRKAEGWPEIEGMVCCDLWDVTFADREILIDILVAGGEAIEANDGIGERDELVKGYARDRDEAAAMLDAYVAAGEYVNRIEVEPGSSLHVYMATGHGAEDFHELFRSPSLSDWPFMNEMFVISETELEIAPDIRDQVDNPDWTWPERYRPSLDAGLSP